MAGYDSRENAAGVRLGRWKLRADGMVDIHRILISPGGVTSEEEQDMAVHDARIYAEQAVLLEP